FFPLSGGMSSYAEAMARDHDVRTGAEVRRVRPCGTGVEVTWVDGGGERKAEFAGCVLAVPAHVAAQVHGALDPARAGFLAGVRYTAMVNLVVGLDEPPAGNRAMYALLGGTGTPELLGVSLEHNKAPRTTPAGRGLLSVYASPEFSARLLDADDDAALAALLPAVEQMLPGTRHRISFTRVCRWDTIAIRSRPGYYGELRRFRDAGAGRDPVIQLAGDYFAPSNLNSATAAGERAGRACASVLASRTHGRRST